MSHQTLASAVVILAGSVLIAGGAVGEGLARAGGRSQGDLPTVALIAGLTLIVVGFFRYVLDVFPGLIAVRRLAERPADNPPTDPHGIKRSP